MEQGGARVWNFSSEGGQSDLACFLSAPGSVLTPPVLAGHLLHVCVCVCVSTCMHLWGVGVEGTLPQGIRHPQETLFWKFQSCSTLAPHLSLLTLRSCPDYLVCVPVTRKVIWQGARETEKGRIAQLF